MLLEAFATLPTDDVRSYWPFAFIERPLASLCMPPTKKSLLAPPRGRMRGCVSAENLNFQTSTATLLQLHSTAAQSQLGAFDATERGAAGKSTSERCLNATRISPQVDAWRVEERHSTFSMYVNGVAGRRALHWH